MRSVPTDSVTKVPPAMLRMITNQGSTSNANQRNPGSGRSAVSQRPSRSIVTRATTARPTNIRISGPFSSTPAASAVQKIAGRIHCEGPSHWRCSGR
jgi:hypothetical protein